MEKQILKDEVDKGLSTYKIAKSLNKGQTTIRYWLGIHGLETKVKHAPKQTRECEHCLGKFKAYKREPTRFCSTTCAGKASRLSITDMKSQTSKRKAMIKKHGNVCMMCDISVWKDEPVPLALDHIDGNSSNGEESNLRLICLNCDGLLPTYKNRNKGNGRHNRMERYNKGLSY